jgi:hypothetical protein
VALARWKKADATWRTANAAVLAQQAVQRQLTNDAHIFDAQLPPQYHGGTC